MCTCTLLSCSTLCDWAYAPLWASTSQRMRHLGEDSSQSSSTDEAAKVYTAPWLRRKGLGDRCSMMMHDATMWNDRYGLVGFGLVWFVMFGWVCLVRYVCLLCLVRFVLLCLLPCLRHISAVIESIRYYVNVSKFSVEISINVLDRMLCMVLASHESRLRLRVPGHHYTCAQAYDLHVFASVVCVCGIKLYFILPLSLQFLYYVTVISYYHILTQYIILEFKISNTKILNLDSPPTHQTQQSTKARRRKRRQRLGSSGIKMRIKFEPCFDPLLSISNRMWISRVYRSSNTVKYLAFETIAIRYNMIVCKYMYFISSIFCNWVCYNSFPAINCKTWTN